MPTVPILLSQTEFPGHHVGRGKPGQARKSSSHTKHFSDHNRIELEINNRSLDNLQIYGNEITLYKKSHGSKKKSKVKLESVLN